MGECLSVVTRCVNSSSGPSRLMTLKPEEIGSVPISAAEIVNLIKNRVSRQVCAVNLKLKSKPANVRLEFFRGNFRNQLDKSWQLLDPIFGRAI